MGNAWTLATATYGDLVRRPLYYATLIMTGLLIYGSSFLTQFTFSMETQLVREMGLASIVLWGFVIAVVMAPVIVTQELEDRTAVTLLSKPIRRSAFLIGKFLGLIGALLPGVAVLAGILFYTLWFMSKSTLFGHPALGRFFMVLCLVSLAAGALFAEIGRRRARAAEADTSGRSPRRMQRWGLALLGLAGVFLILWLEFSRGRLSDGDLGWQRLTAAGHSVWDYAAAFLRESGLVVLQGALLSLLQLTILSAVAVSIAAFAPPVVSAAGTAFVYILGNLSAPMQASLERLGWAPLTAAGKVLWVVVPDLGLFNLQTHFSEGKIITLSYLGMAALHAGLYASIVFVVACALFERREIR